MILLRYEDGTIYGNDGEVVICCLVEDDVAEALVAAVNACQELGIPPEELVERWRALDKANTDLGSQLIKARAENEELRAALSAYREERQDRRSWEANNEN
ncbi:MAG: hypothetical protein ACE5I2_07455 [Anaerolineae bacterium]